MTSPQRRLGIHNNESFLLRNHHKYQTCSNKCLEKLCEYILHKFQSVYCWNKKVKDFFLLDVKLKGYSALFENIKWLDGNQQIRFIGVPFIIIGMKRLDCVHGVDRCNLWWYLWFFDNQNSRFEKVRQEHSVFIL